MKNKGFTLIELMITVAILAIIMGIAIPAYNNQVEKTRRADAIAGLMQAAQQLERCFTRTNTYAGCGVFPQDSPDGYYTIAAPTRGASSFSLTATGKGSQTKDDCSPFGLDHLGNKTAKSSTDRCWGQ